MQLNSWVQRLTTAARTASPYRTAPRQRRPLSRMVVRMESLEARELLSIDPISLVDPSFFSDTANGHSRLTQEAASISADGQLIVFQSSTNDLAPNDHNQASNGAGPLNDVFLFNRATGVTSLISINAAGTSSGDSNSFNAKISEDGRYVLFESEAGDLTSESIITGGGSPDIFLRDLQTGTTTLISKSLSGTTGGNGGSFDANISADGRYVVFSSHASNLVAGDTNGVADIFSRDLLTGTTTLVSHVPGNPTVGGNDHSLDPRISADGRFVAFVSHADNLVSNDGTNIEDIFVWDRQTSVTELISVDSNEINQSDAHNSLAVGRAFSADGRYVLFETAASNLVPQTAAFEGRNVYLRDRQLGTTVVVTIGASGLNATGGSAATMTPDGRYVAFVSAEVDLIAGLSDTNGTYDVFLRDMQSGTTELVSRNALGTATGNRSSGVAQYPFDFSTGSLVLSTDGRFVAFTSEASNLVIGRTDPNDARTEAFGTHRRDVFLRDRLTGTTSLISENLAGTAAGENGSFTPAMSADGSVIAFESLASDLVAGSDPLGHLDVFVRDVTAGRTDLASMRTPFFPDWQLQNGGGTLTSATPDGRFVSFTSANQAFVLDRVTGSVDHVSRRADGTPDTGSNGQLSADGRFVVLNSSANLASMGPSATGSQIWLHDRATDVTRLVSVTPAGLAAGANEWSSQIAFTQDGRYVAWTSSSHDLVDNFVDGNGTGFTFGIHDIFIRDLHTGVTRLVSHIPGSSNESGNAGAQKPVFSDDGSQLIFMSRATNLVAGIPDTNTSDDLFAYDVQSGAIELISVNTAGTATGNRGSTDAVVSADGRYVAFHTTAGDIGFGGVTNGYNVYVRDLVADTTTLVSVNSAGTAGGNANSYTPSMSADGRFIAFASDAGNLVAGDTGRTDVFVRDMVNGITTRVSVTPSGGQANWHANEPVISPDGRRVSFESEASDLVANYVDLNGGFENDDLYVRDLVTGVTDLVSVNDSGTGSGNLRAVPNDSLRIFTADGETLFFTGNPRDLVAGDRNAVADVFAYTFEGAGQIRGTVFLDADRDGTQDAGEGPLPYWTVYVDTDGDGQFDEGERSVRTDLDGNYSLNGLAAGTYTVAFELRDGFTRTAPATPGTYSVTLPTATSVVTDRTFGAAAAPVDLQVTGITGPTNVAAGRELDVSWIVRNLGESPIIGDWQDAIYLSGDGVLDAGDTLVTVLPHVGGLEAGASYATSTSIIVPPHLLGTFRVIVQTDRRRQVVNDLNPVNNVAVGNPIQTSIPSLVLGTPLEDQFTSANQDRYFQVTVNPGDSLTVVLDSAAQSGSTELYVRRLQLPTAWEYDFASRTPSEPDQTLTVPVTLPGVYYVLARSRAGAATASTYTVTASQPVFALDGVSPSTAGNTGSATVEIRGTRFTPNTQVSLVSGNTTINATSIDYRDSSLLYATFDLTGHPIGAFDVKLTEGVLTAILANGFAVVPGQSGGLDLQVLTPEFVRFAREGKLVVEYVNTSSNDMVAPLLRITADKALFRNEGRPNFESQEIYVLGISSNGPAGVLRPGERGRIELPFLAMPAGGIFPPPSDPTHDPNAINFDVFLADGQLSMDWAAIKETLRPGHITPEAWDAVFANFASVVGTTAADYQALLAQAATYLSQAGIYTSDVMRLLAFELDKADAAYTARTLATVVDVNFPTPGIDLTFSREFQQAIHGRYALGAFGRGWTHNWDIQATTLADDNVVVRFGGSRRMFFEQPDGSYRSGIGDYATLTLANGVYTLSEIDSTIWQFRADGLLDFWQEDNGNRVTSGYTGGKLTSLTHSSGATITLQYNPQGQISQLTDPGGRIVTYAYDASGDHLTTYTDKYGTHTYTYFTGQGLSREHALASINYSDDTQVLYSYDPMGRLIGEQRDDGSTVPIQYEYPAGGGLIRIDSAGGRTTQLFDDAGLMVRSVDPLGRVVDYTYDSHRNLIRADLPQGVQYSYGYDERGNVVRSIDPLGNATEFAWDSNGNMLHFRDAHGHATQYNYDAHDNLQAITYANGTVEQFEYDTFGNPTQSTNRRGAAIGYGYNSRGQLTQKNFADGTQVDYEYDTRGNLISATDAEGTTTLTYNSLDALERITYPDGKFLEFTYNTVVQRTRSVDHDGFTTNYHYDGLGRLERLTDAADALIVQYTYDGAGRLVRKDNGNGTASTYQYDLAGQLLQLRHLAPDGTTVNSFYEYTYDLLGRRTTQTTADGTTFYGYDSLGQLTSVSLPGGRVITYVYDAVGNRSSVTDNGITTQYTTNVMNEYVLVGNTIYTYDADGNLTSKSDANGNTAYSFDDENRLVGVNGSGLNAVYTYNPFGQRNSATIDGQTTSYLVDPVGLWSITAEYDGNGSLLANYTYSVGLSTFGFGLTSRVASNGTAAYFDFDATGNTVGLTNAAGAYANRYSYLPFGETTVLASAVANPFTFVGQFGVMNDGSGTFDLRMRNYDPARGQFLSNDPIGFAAGDVNFRRYAGNDPVSRIDPVGLDWWCPWKKDDKGPKKEDLEKNPVTGNPLKDWMRNLENIVKTLGELNRASNANPNGPAPPSGSGSGGPGGCGCECPPGAQPSAPGGKVGGGKSSPVGAFDPNDITGPSGFGDEHFVTPLQTFQYTIRFENDPEFATAPALEVFITHQLDADLDWSTVELDDFGFGSLVIDVPNGLQSYRTRVTYKNQDESDLFVDVDANFDLATGLLSWTFRSVDPLTGFLPPGVFDGFLPVNDDTGVGEGFVRYQVRSAASLITGTTIDQQASIVFDVNAPIETNIFTNTIDAGPPTSSVNTLPARSWSPFIVSWSGSDDAGGSGIGSYDVYVSDNGGPYSLLLSATTLTSTTFTGLPGHAYSFYTVATDNVGNREEGPANPDATTATPLAFTAPAATTTSQRPVVEWTPVFGAVSYDVWINRETVGTIPVQQFTVTTTSFTPTMDLGIGSFAVWVRSTNDAGETSIWSPRHNFRINTQAMFQPMTRLQPTTKPTVAWASLLGAAKYDLWIDNVTTGEVQFVRDQTITTTSWTSATDLAPGVYRAWVRGIDAGGKPASWSHPLEFQVSPRVVPTTMAAMQPTSRPTIQWSPLVGAAKYDLWIDNRTTGQVQYLRDQNITTTSWTSPVDMPLGVYRFWIRGIDSSGTAFQWSVFREFTVATPPQLTAPLNSTFNRQPTFTWNAVTGATKYEVQVRNLATGALIHETEITSPNWTPSANLSDGPYRWWAIAIGTNNVRGLWSAPVDFHVGGQTTLLTPTGSSSDTTPTFSWNPVDGANRYELWVTNVALNARLIHETTLTTTSFTPTTALPTGTYRAWVRAISSTGETGIWSAQFNFVIAATDSSHLDLSLGPVLLTSLHLADSLLQDSDESVDGLHSGGTFINEGESRESVQDQNTTSAFWIAAQNQTVHLPIDGLADKHRNIPQSNFVAQNESPEERLLDALMSQFCELDFGDTF
jgi:RHS repeat-associated protein